MDIRDVPSEMPIYLLAEDEGNEEEILRLLESESPGGSPQNGDKSIRVTSADAACHGANKKGPCKDTMYEHRTTSPSTSEQIISIPSRG